MTEHKIEIDMDKPCTKCGQMGAMPNGICMECAAGSIIDNGERIFVESLVSASKQINKLMAIHSDEARKAYIKSDDGKLNIGLSVELSPSEEVQNAIKVKVKINFVESRVKDESMERVSSQQKLPLEEE